MISQDTIEEIKSRSDIVQIIGSFVELKRSGSTSYKGLCPFHNEKTPSFSVDSARQTYHCFGCGKGGTVFSFVMEKNGMSFIDAVKFLAARANVVIQEEGDFNSEKTKKIRNIKEVCQVFKKFFSNNLKLSNQALEFLQNQAISNEVIETFEIGAALHEDESFYQHAQSKGLAAEDLRNAGIAWIRRDNRCINQFRNSLIFPISDAAGRLTGFWSELYYNAPQNVKPKNSDTILFRKEKLLFGLHQANSFISKSESVILCSNPLDVLRLSSVGIKNSVGLLGCNFTSEQALLLKRNARKVILAYGNTYEERQVFMRVVEKLLPHSMELFVLNLPENTSIGSLVINNEIEKLNDAINNAHQWLKYMASLLPDLYELKDEEQLKRARGHLDKFIKTVSNPVEKEVYQQQSNQIFDDIVNGLIPEKLYHTIAEEPNVKQASLGATFSNSKVEKNEVVPPKVTPVVPNSPKEELNNLPEVEELNTGFYEEIPHNIPVDIQENFNATSYNNFETVSTFNPDDCIPFNGDIIFETTNLDDPNFSYEEPVNNLVTPQENANLEVPQFDLTRKRQELKRQVRLSSLIAKFEKLEILGPSLFTCKCFNKCGSLTALRIDDMTGHYHCPGCGITGDVVDFLISYGHKTLPEAIEYLENYKVDEKVEEFINNSYIQTTGKLPTLENSYPKLVTEEELRSQAQVEVNFVERIYQVCNFFSRYFISLLTNNSPAGQYLQKRGITSDIAQKFQIGASPSGWDNGVKIALQHSFNENELLAADVAIKSKRGSLIDRFKERLIFTICDMDGRPVGFSARVLEAKAAFGGKYVNTSETCVFKKGSLLYAHHLAKMEMRKTNTAILCEGQMDVIAFHRANICNAVAPLGTAFTSEQAKLLVRDSQKIIIAFDGDGAGQKAFLRALEILLPLTSNIYALVFPNGQDPDEIFTAMGPKGLQDIVDNAIDWVDRLGQMLPEMYNFNSPVERGQAANKAATYLSLVENQDTLIGFIARFAKSLEVSDNVLTSAVNDQRNKLNNREFWSGNSNSVEDSATSLQLEIIPKKEDTLSKIILDEDIIDHIRSSCNVEKLLENYTTLSQNDSFVLKGTCPFHNSGNSSFAISKLLHIFYCSECGKYGDIFDFLMEKENISLSAACAIASKYSDIMLPENSWVSKDAYNEGAKAELLYQTNEAYLYLGKYLLNSASDSKGRDYLARLGISPEVCDSLEIAYSNNNWKDIYNYLQKCNYTDEEIIAAGIAKRNENNEIYGVYKNRLLFPIKNQAKRVVGFIGVSLNENIEMNLKAIVTKENEIFKRNIQLYNFDNALEYIKESKTVILVTTPVEVAVLNSCGIFNVVSMLGLFVPKNLIDTLTAIANNIIIVTNNDESSQRQRNRLIKAFLPSGKNVSGIIIREDLTLDELLLEENHQELKDSIANYKSYLEVVKSDFLFFDSQIDAVAQAIAQILVEIPEPLLTSCVRESVKVLRIPENELYKKLRQERKNLERTMEFKPKTASSRTRETARKMEAYPAALKTLLELALSSVDLARNIADLMDGETIEEKDQLSTIFNVVLGSALNGDPKSNLATIHKILKEEKTGHLYAFLTSDVTYKNPRKAMEDSIACLRKGKGKLTIKELKEKLAIAPTMEERFAILKQIEELNRKQK